MPPVDRRFATTPARPLGLALLLTLTSLPAARADLAVVPADYPTIQAAVDAVQGTTGARVRIDSDSTFAETIVASRSVTIEGGRGFTPVLRADNQYHGTVVTLAPEDGGSATLTLRRLTLAPASARALIARGDGSVRLEGIRLHLDAPGGRGFDIGDRQDFSLRDSTVQIAPTAGPFPELGSFTGSSIGRIANNSFLVPERVRTLWRRGDSALLRISGSRCAKPGSPAAPSDGFCGVERDAAR